MFTVAKRSKAADELYSYNSRRWCGGFKLCRFEQSGVVDGSRDYSWNKRSDPHVTFPSLLHLPLQGLQNCDLTPILDAKC
ncbi:hypothetical protein J6590_053232 [Homalodisca vitripennis]|nr:hypothetical protein J6590_053232 [Homalodisca vitripennis]